MCAYVRVCLCVCVVILMSIDRANLLTDLKRSESESATTVVLSCVFVCVCVFLTCIDRADRLTNVCVRACACLLLVRLHVCLSVSWRYYAGILFGESAAVPVNGARY